MNVCYPTQCLGVSGIIGANQGAADPRRCGKQTKITRRLTLRKDSFFLGLFAKLNCSALVFVRVRQPAATVLPSNNAANCTGISPWAFAALVIVTRLCEQRYDRISHRATDPWSLDQPVRRRCVYWPQLQQRVQLQHYKLYDSLGTDTKNSSTSDGIQQSASVICTGLHRSDCLSLRRVIDESKVY